MPGKPGESLIVEAVNYRDTLQMPPDAKLSDKQIELVSKWVALGLALARSSGSGGFVRRTKDLKRLPIH